MRRLSFSVKQDDTYQFPFEKPSDSVDTIDANYTLKKMNNQSPSRKHHSYLFTLKLNTSKGMVVIDAFESGHMQPNHTKINVVVKLKGKAIFEYGTMWGGVPAHVSIDGDAAKEHVLALVAMKPGDTDADYFKDYTPEQLEFANLLGEEISMIRDYRYCDPETGECRT